MLEAVERFEEALESRGGDLFVSEGPGGVTRERDDVHFGIRPYGGKEEPMAVPCRHLDQVRDVEPRPPHGCAECLESGGSWVHLRLCMTCGHVGCCDSSPGKHATKHFHRSGHAIVRSYEAGEQWLWCYADQVMLEPAM